MPEQESQPQGGSSELASFGEDLRREREIRGISLKEISDATKISKRFLEAIENNDHRTLPAPVFTRGFVREYARYVGLNAEEMVNRYNFAAASDDRIEKPPQVEKYAAVPPKDITPKPKPKRGIPAPYARVNRNALSLFVLAALLAGVVWWTVQHRKGFLETETPASVPVTTKAVAPPPVTTSAPEPVADDSVLRLTVEVTGDSWVSLEADGKSVVNDELKAGDKRTFEANETFRFRTIGNAAGLSLTLNGTRIPSLGGEGDVIKNKSFDRDSLRALREEVPSASGLTAPSTTP
ncbi:MAG TPA: RodZ domain-containing protein [Thermoanaerobaculia bacterium]|nr:RodZ domain-containing protein [Thermoanaerobaculia bacterium]